MATETLAVRLLLDAGQYKREARSASTATGKITGSAQTATAATGRMQTGLGNLATTAKFAIAGAATAAVVGFAKDSVRAATDLKESINAVNVVFGDSADAILAIGENSATSFGLAQSEFNSFAVRFSNFAETIADEAGETVPRVINDLTGRIADFASVMNIDVPEAADKFQSALAGQSRPIAEYGIDVRDAAVQQKALELGIVSTGETMTQTEKEFVRYRILMDETADTAGDFANTSDDLANATRIFNKQLENFKATSGAGAEGVLAELVLTGSDLLTVVNGLADALPSFGEEAEDVGIAGGFVNTVFGGLPRVLEEAAGWFDDTGGEAAEAASKMTDLEKRAREGLPKAAGEAENLADKMDEARSETAKANIKFAQSRKPLQDIGVQAGNAAQGIRNIISAQRALIDPAFAALEALDGVADAEQRLADLKDDPAATQRELDSATRDLLIAVSNLNIAAGEYATVEGKALIEALEDLGEQANLSDEDLQRVLDLLMELNGLEVVSTVRTEIIQETRLRTIREAIQRGDVPELRQHGGPVQAGSPYIVGETGPELFIPDTSGTVIANQSITQTEPRNSGPSVTITGDVYGFDDFVEKVEAAGAQLNRLGR